MSDDQTRDEITLDEVERIGIRPFLFPSVGLSWLEDRCPNLPIDEAWLFPGGASAEVKWQGGGIRLLAIPPDARVAAAIGVD